MLRKRKNIIKEVIKLDVFPKTSEECVEKSSTRGTVSLLSFILIGILVIGEVNHFFTTKFVYKFMPDVEFQKQLKFNIDMTVATPCADIGADIIDAASKQIAMINIKSHDVLWTLDDAQREHFDTMSELNKNLRDNMHSVHDVIWKSGYIFQPTPKRKIDDIKNSKACRYIGTAHLNKVAGTFHILPGMPILIPGGHAHVQFSNGAALGMNLSHRIDRLSFGDVVTGVVQPLEGDQVIANTDKMSYKYFLKIVPTDINMYSLRADTFQYSVTEQARIIDHDKGSHGSPGIYVKYDLSALKVTVTEKHPESFIKFITRLAAIGSGILMTSGFLNSLVEVIFSFLWCKYKKEIESDKSLECSMNKINNEAGGNLTSSNGHKNVLLNNQHIPHISPIAIATADQIQNHKALGTSNDKAEN